MKKECVYKVHRAFSSTQLSFIMYAAMMLKGCFKGASKSVQYTIERSIIFGGSTNCGFNNFGGLKFVGGQHFWGSKLFAGVKNLSESTFVGGGIFWFENLGGVNKFLG
jgi:hypothetical protein